MKISRSTKENYELGQLRDFHDLINYYIELLSTIQSMKPNEKGQVQAKIPKNFDDIILQIRTLCNNTGLVMSQMFERSVFGEYVQELKKEREQNKKRGIQKDIKEFETYKHHNVNSESKKYYIGYEERIENAFAEQPFFKKLVKKYPNLSPTEIAYQLRNCFAHANNFIKFEEIENTVEEDKDKYYIKTDIRGMKIHIDNGKIETDLSIKDVYMLQLVYTNLYWTYSGNRPANFYFFKREGDNHERFYYNCKKMKLIGEDNPDENMSINKRYREFKSANPMYSSVLPLDKIRWLRKNCGFNDFDYEIRSLNEKEKKTLDAYITYLGDNLWNKFLRYYNPQIIQEVLENIISGIDDNEINAMIVDNFIDTINRTNQNSQNLLAKVRLGKRYFSRTYYLC